MKRMTGFVFAMLAGGLLHAQEPATYATTIDQWHRQREEGLKRENGWLNLVGLYWLKPGRNYFGADSANDIVFPKGTIAPRAGYFEWKDNRVVLAAETTAAILVDTQPVGNAIVYHPDSLRAPLASSGSLRWTVIKRDDKIGVRLRDLNSAAIAAFKGIARYNVDPSWKTEAVLQTAGLPGQISITNVLGQTNLQKSAGKRRFSLHGKSYTLDALDEGDELFVIFSDATNGSETYPSGRFLYVKRPDATGKTIIDFNKAYNPPCAFTDYATCPLPPKENRLPIAVTAGEKKYSLH